MNVLRLQVCVQTAVIGKLTRSSVEELRINRLFSRSLRRKQTTTSLLRFHARHRMRSYVHLKLFARSMVNHILAPYFKPLPQITVVSLRDWQRLKIGVLEFTLHIRILLGRDLRMSVIIESFAEMFQKECLLTVFLKRRSYLSPMK